MTINRDSQTHDGNGVEYAKLQELEVGETVLVDAGFDCMNAGAHIVRKDAGGLFLFCTPKDSATTEHHYLEGLFDDGIHCVGIYKKDLPV